MTPKQKAKQLHDQFILFQYSNLRSDGQAWKSVELVADEMLHEIDHQLQGFLDADRIRYWETIKKIANDSQG